MRSVKSLIRQIIFSRVPSKIIDVIICACAVIVTSIQSFSGRIFKRGQYGSMNVDTRTISTFLKGYLTISIASRFLAQNATLVWMQIWFPARGQARNEPGKGSDLPEGRCFIESLEARDWFPLFNQHALRLSRLVIAFTYRVL